MLKAFSLAGAAAASLPHEVRLVLQLADKGLMLWKLLNVNIITVLNQVLP